MRRKGNCRMERIGDAWEMILRHALPRSAHRDRIDMIFAERIFEMEQGLINIYCGDGKGKTSAAIGLAVRAAGCGRRVLFARFLKNENSGELKILDSIPEIEVLHLEKSYGFFKTLSGEEREEAQRMYARLWAEILERTQREEFGLLVIDEFMAAYNYGLIPHEEALRFLREKPEGLEIALTGRDPGPELVELADYVSEIHKVKHPFDRGIRARRGIEF